MSYRSLRTVFLTLSILSCMVAGEASSKEIPKDVAPVLTAYESEAKKAWDVYQAALQKAEDKAKKDLNAKMAPALKKGDLDTANAIRGYMDKVTSGDMVANLEKEWKDNQKNPDLLGDKNTQLLIVGRWGNDGILRWEFLADGTGKHFWGPTTYNCNWEYKNGEYTVYVDGPSPKRPLKIIDKNSISLEPGISSRMIK